MNATFYLHLRFGAQVVPHFPTTANFNLALRFVSGQFGESGGGSGIVKRKVLLPGKDTPFLDAAGCVVDVWYRFLQFQWEKKIGGDLAPTLPQIASVAASTQASSAAIAGTLTNVVQVVENNAAAQTASNEALVAANVPGTTQIPTPIVTVPDHSNSNLNNL